MNEVTYPHEERDRRILDMLWERVEATARPETVAVVTAERELNRYVTGWEPNELAEESPTAFEEAYNKGISALRDALLSPELQDKPGWLLERLGDFLLLEREEARIDNARTYELLDIWMCLSMGVEERLDGEWPDSEYFSNLARAAIALNKSLDEYLPDSGGDPQT